MRTIFITLVVFCRLLVSAQTTPILFIDNTPIKFQGDISLPYWVGAGKSVQLGQDAVSASILEFTLVNNEMEFSQAIHLTSNSTVPTGKVWKIEAIGIGNNPSHNSINNFSNSNYPSIFNSPITFSTPGTYSWTVPPGVTNICIEAWGGGGGGGAGLYTSNDNFGQGGGGGGGGYGYQCFTVVPGTSLSITVGSGGNAGANGQNSSVSTFITSYGGLAGSIGTSLANGLGGQGGSSAASYVITGQNGANGTSSVGGDGGKGGNGGNGGAGSGGSWSTTYYNYASSTAGISPGGGGGGGQNYNGSTYTNASKGANGQIKIYF